MTYRQIAVKESKDLIMPVLFGLLLVSFGYVLACRDSPVVYGVMVFSLVWQTAILAVLLNVRRDVIRWAKVYRSL